MDLAALKSEIMADPAMLAMARAEVPDTRAIADALSVGRTKVVTRFGGVGAVMEALGPDAGAAVLDGIKALAGTNATVRWAWLLVERGELDFGSPATRAQLGSLRDGGSISPEVCAALLGIALAPDQVNEMDVRRAIWNDDGTRAI